MYVTRRSHIPPPGFNTQSTSLMEDSRQQQKPETSLKTALYGVGGIPLQSQKIFPAAMKKSLKDCFSVIWKNPAFKSTLDDDGDRQHTLYDQPIYRPYPKMKDGDKNEFRNMEIGKGADSVVISRRNPYASVYAKFPHDHEVYFYTFDEEATCLYTIDELKKRAEILNEIAALFLEKDEETNLMRGHFAVELMKDIRGSEARPIPTYCTPAVKGFSLEDYINDPSKYAAYAAELSGESLNSKMEELRNALKWLHRKGFVHKDVKLGNIVFDTENKKLVLVDLEFAIKLSKEKPDIEKKVAKDLEWERFNTCEVYMKELHS